MAEAGPEPKAIERKHAFTRSDLILSSSDWGSLLVAVLSREGNVDCSVQRVRRAAEEAIRRELLFCAHLGMLVYNWLVSLQRNSY